MQVFEETGFEMRGLANDDVSHYIERRIQVCIANQPKCKAVLPSFPSFHLARVALEQCMCPRSLTCHARTL
jgi:hypothetical protein